MKIRRIDHQDILSHARNYQKSSHRPTVSDFTPFQQLHLVNRSERASMELKIIKERITARNQRKKQNTLQTEDSTKIMAIYEKIKFLYSKLSTMYRTNESKLTSLLLRHIKMEYYIFSKEIMQLVKNLRLNKENVDICYHSQPKKIIHELIKFKEYLQQFYERKCLKQIEIIEDNILQREQAIRDNTSFDRYKTITNSFRPSLITNNVNIVEQFKQMSAVNGPFRELSRVQCSLFKKLRSTQHKISKIFTSVCNSKEKHHFICNVEDVN